ncbi:hypothetical protein LIA77_10427 [Sarocladium implicatum]|nr:hypothetical protein LIA77_10427 [Sarocladium implicatum]
MILVSSLALVTSVATSCSCRDSHPQPPTVRWKSTITMATTHHRRTSAFQLQDWITCRFYSRLWNQSFKFMNHGKSWSVRLAPTRDAAFSFPVCNRSIHRSKRSKLRR